MSRGARAWKLSAFLLVASCTTVPAVEKDRAAIWTQHTASQVAMPETVGARQRLHTVAFPILRTAVEFCEVTRPYFGLSIAGRRGPARTKVGAKGGSHSAAAGATVSYAIPGSPADLAGVREGDIVLSSNGVPLPQGFQKSQFLFDAAERTDGYLLRLIIRRGAVRRNIQISPVEICDIEVGLTISATTAAWARSNKVTVSDRMLRFAASDDELAFAISHEVSHIILGHSASSLGRVSAGLEREADHVGLYIMVRAGYDAQRGIYLLKRLAKAFPWWDDGTQPSLMARYKSIAKVASGIGH